MKILMVYLIALGLIVIPTNTLANHIIVNKIDYAAVAPPDYVLEDNYGGIGIDSAGWIYHAIDGFYTGVGIEDSAVFRYHPLTGNKEFLGSLRDISAAELNLSEDENISKIHAPIYEHQGMIYIASHPFHHRDDIRRGGHFYSFDPTNYAWTDLSKFDKDGISVPGQGIITMDVLPQHHKLVGFTFPKGEVVSYDLEKNQTTNHGRSTASDPYNVSRYIVTSDAGKVYYSYAGENERLYEYDIVKNTMKATDHVLSYGWIAGVAYNASRTIAYLVDKKGNLYALNLTTEAFSKLGRLTPAGEYSDYSVFWIHGLIISNDDKFLYTLPRMDVGTEYLYILYSYDIETGEKRAEHVTDLEGHVVGGVASQEGDLYFHNHIEHGSYVRLVQIKITNEHHDNDGADIGCSSVERLGLECAKAYDNDSTTRWSSAFSDNEWIAVDLGNPQTIYGVTLHWEAAYGAWYEIQISDDAQNWTTVYEEYAGDGGIDEIDFDAPAEDVRYSRMLGIKRGTSWGYSLWEFEVKTEADEPSPPPPDMCSSMERAGLECEKAFDGVSSTRWSSRYTDDEWIIADLGSEQMVYGVVLNWETAYGAEYEIEVSNDKSNWTLAYTENGSNGGMDDIDFASPQNARYVKMKGIRRGTSWGYSLWEFEVKVDGDSYTCDLAKQRPVVCSSIERSGLECDKAVDENLVTRWSSSFTHNQWIYVDLGAPQTVNGVRLNWEAAYGKVYEIQVSEDANTWNTVRTENAGNGGIDDITFDMPATNFRYVRMLGIQRGTPYGYSLWEFEVCGGN